MSHDASDADRREGDLTRTGMALKHDREWDYELDRIVAEVEDRDAGTVGLQFPEGLKRRGPRVADDLRELLDDGVTVMISGQPCYGACDLDTYLMRRTDVFVHFGHSPMKESDKIIYVPLFSNVAVEPIVDRAIGEELVAPEDADVGLVTTAQHMNRFGEMREQLEAAGYEVHTRCGDDRHAADYDHPDVIVPEGATTAVGLLANHSRTGIDAATHPVSVDDRIAGLRRPIHLPVVPGVFERAGCKW